MVTLTYSLTWSKGGKDELKIHSRRKIIGVIRFTCQRPSCCGWLRCTPAAGVFLPFLKSKPSKISAAVKQRKSCTFSAFHSRAYLPPQHMLSLVHTVVLCCSLMKNSCTWVIQSFNVSSFSYLPGRAFSKMLIIQNTSARVSAHSTSVVSLWSTVQSLKFIVAKWDQRVFLMV